MEPKCKDCKERSVGCHSICIDYREWRKWKDQENDFIRKKQNYDRLQKKPYRKRRLK